MANTGPSLFLHGKWDVHMNDIDDGYIISDSNIKNRTDIEINESGSHVFISVLLLHETPFGDDTIGMFSTEPYLHKQNEDGEWSDVYPEKAGTIIFLSRKWDESVVAHECAHAALALARREGFLKRLQNHVDEHEEKFCLYIGNITSKIYRWLWKVDI